MKKVNKITLDWTEFFAKINEEQKRKFWRDKITKFLESKVMNMALDFIARKAAWMLKGPIGWVTSLVLKKLWKKWGKTTISFLSISGALRYDKVKGEFRINNIDTAKEEGNEQDYINVISNI